MKRYVNAALSKRFGAFILDFFSMILGATILFLVCMEVFSNSTLMREANEEINKIQVSSFLYKYKDDSKQITMVVDEKEYEIALKKYYFEYKKDSETYYKKMNESELFDIVDNSFVPKKDVSEEDVKDLYELMMGEAILEIKNDPNYKKCSDIIINCELYCIAISILISYIVFIIVIPCLRKNKNTIGQSVLKISLISSENNEIPSNTQIIFRSIIILIIEMYLSTYCFYIPVLISVVMIAINKNKMSYHDILSSTKMIDYHYVELDDKLNKGKN